MCAYKQALRGCLNQLMSVYSNNTKVVGAQSEQVLRYYTNLKPRIGVMKRAQGMMNLLYLEGTIPVFYKKNRYHIPIKLWVTELYPVSPPALYVTPTATMIIKNNHKHVDTSGYTYLSYLTNWNPSKSTLAGVLQEACNIFSVDPPVRAKPSGSYQSSGGQQQGTRVPPQSFRQAQQPQMYANQQAPGYTESLAHGNANSMGNRGYNQQPAVNVDELYMKNARISLQEKLKTSCVSMLKERNIEDIIKKQRNEKEDEKMYRKEIEEMQTLTDKLEKEIDGLEAQNSGLDDYLRKSGGEEGDLDKLTDPKIIIKRQLIQNVAQNVAIEDVIYYLDKSLARDVISYDVYYKTMRQYCRNQFFARATMNKLIELQQQLGL